MNQTNFKKAARFQFTFHNTHTVTQPLGPVTARVSLGIKSLGQGIDSAAICAVKLLASSKPKIGTVVENNHVRAPLHHLLQQ